uniref:Uncharacterized protein n=1 Tax=Pyxicephalus adspersus TaxID=30357 RepID=A0AAV2ZZK9_PYXAD|nr:TPA: hypothetical protein GDO54_002993 [Pyxicephalus adspersus]
MLVLHIQNGIKKAEARFLYPERKYFYSDPGVRMLLCSAGNMERKTATPLIPKRLYCCSQMIYCSFHILFFFIYTLFTISKAQVYWRLKVSLHLDKCDPWGQADKSLNNNH